MPGKNGKEAYTEIRVISAFIRVIFVSGHAEDIFSREGLLEQGINFGRKPVTLLALVNKVRKVLDA